MVWGPCALVLVAGLAYGGMLVAESMAESERRNQVLADVDATLQKEGLDGGELSRLSALIQKFADHATARDLLGAQARIELARGRPEKAQQLFLELATAPGAAAKDQRIGMEILLRQHEADVADKTRANGVLEQVLQLSDSVYPELRAAPVLLMAWQAAARLARDERSAAAANQLRSDHPDSPETRFVEFARAFTGVQRVDAIEAAVVGVVPPPIEAEAMRMAALLQAGDLPGAVAVAERALGRGPGVATLRSVAVAVFHSCALGCAADSEDRERWCTRRDAQIDWLLLNGNLGPGPMAELQATRAAR